MSLIVASYGIAAMNAGGNQSPWSTYNVTFVENAKPEPVKSGLVEFYMSVTMEFPTDQQNLTTFMILLTWTDLSASPLTDPAVTLEVTPPQWVQEDGGVYGTFTAHPPPFGYPVEIPINSIPQNTTVLAPSTEEAIRLATTNQTNETAGMGSWVVKISVTGPAAGRLRASGSIAFDLEVVFSHFEAEAALRR